MSFATITMKGRLGRDPELKQVGQNQVCKLAVATSERWNDQSGQRQEKTTWHNVEFWGKQAENVAKFFKKGDEIFVMGDVTSDEWIDQQGQKRTAQKVKGFKFDFVGGTSQQAQLQQNNAPQAQTAYAPPVQGAPNWEQQPQTQQGYAHNPAPLPIPKAGAIDEDVPFNALNGQLAHLV